MERATVVSSAINASGLGIEVVIFREML